MMNKKGESESEGSDALWSEVAPLIVILLFVAISVFFISRFDGGGAFFEDVHAKEIARVINIAEPGTEIYYDVTDLTKQAVKNGLSVHDVVFIDNVENSVTTSVRPGSGTSYYFFNDVDVVETRIEVLSGGETTNRLYFRIRGIEEEGLFS